MSEPGICICFPAFARFKAWLRLEFACLFNSRLTTEVSTFSLLQQQNFVKLCCGSFDLGAWEHLQSPGGGTCRLELGGGVILTGQE